MVIQPWVKAIGYFGGGIAGGLAAGHYAGHEHTSAAGDIAIAASIPATMIAGDLGARLVQRWRVNEQELVASVLVQRRAPLVAKGLFGRAAIVAVGMLAGEGMRASTSPTHAAGAAGSIS